MDDVRVSTRTQRYYSFKSGTVLVGSNSEDIHLLVWQNGVCHTWLNLYNGEIFTAARYQDYNDGDWKVLGEDEL